ALGSVATGDKQTLECWSRWVLRCNATAVAYTLPVMIRWRTIRGLVRSRPLIAVGVVFVGTPVVAIALSWFKTEWGIGTLSPWLKVAYFASLMYLLALAIYAVGC